MIRARHPVLAGVAIVLVTAAVAVFSGLVASLGSPFLIMILTGLIASVILLAVPLELFLVLVGVLTFLVQGNLAYFLRLTQAAWIPYLLCAVALVRVMLGLFAPPREQPEPIRGLLSFTLGALVLHLVILLAGVALNRPGFGQVVAGFKNALPFWVITAMLVANPDKERSYPWLWRLFYVTLFMQIPLVLIQHFVIRVQRADAESTGMDAVVGSFGGNINGGGASATLVAFVLFMMAYQFARSLRRQSGWLATALIEALGLGLILMGEVKAIFVWLPVAVLYLMRRRLLAKPMQAVLALSMMTAVLAGTFIAYDALYWSGGSGKRSIAERIEGMYYFFDPNSINFKTGEISRGASLALWVTDLKVDTARRIIGYGSGSTRVSATVGMGEVARRFAPLSVASTALATLLWDTGIIGALSYCAVLAGTLLMALRLGHHPALDPPEQARIEAIGVFMLVAMTLLIYNRALTDEPSIQMMLVIGVGYVASQWRLAMRRERETPRNIPAPMAHPPVPRGLGAWSPQSP
jgi:hypothetical protein